MTTFLSCDLDDDDGVNSELPEITSVGANTFGCKINDQIYLPKKGSFCLDCANTPKLNFKYGYVFEEGYRLSIFTFNDINGTISISIDLFNGETPFSVGQYEISESYLDLKDILFPNASCRIDKEISGEIINSDFYTNTEITGFLYISKIDSDKKFVSGTFYFEATNGIGKNIEVTDGRFDITYEDF